MQKDQEKLAKKIDKYVKENNSLLKKHKLTSRIVIVFPLGKKPSLISKLAVWFLGIKGAGFDTEFSIKK